MDVKKCIECDSELQGGQVKFCSNNCKQRNHWHKVKEQPNTYHSQTIRSYKRKIKLIELSGGKCNVCGYNKNISALHFHHKDANKKEFTLDGRTLSNKKWELLLKEHEKCELLCANCHQEHHNPEMGLVNITLIVESLPEKRTDSIINKPKCVDCGIDINYTYNRCKECNYKDMRKVIRPDLNLLQNELNEFGVTWCSKKYNVSRRTITRWLNKGIQ